MVMDSTCLKCTQNDYRLATLPAVVTKPPVRSEFREERIILTYVCRATVDHGEDSTAGGSFMGQGVRLGSFTSSHMHHTHTPNKQIDNSNNSFAKHFLVSGADSGVQHCCTFGYSSAPLPVVLFAITPPRLDGLKERLIHRETEAGASYSRLTLKWGPSCILTFSESGLASFDCP